MSYAATATSIILISLINIWIYALLLFIAVTMVKLFFSLKKYMEILSNVFVFILYVLISKYHIYCIMIF